LQQIQEGDAGAYDALLPLVYDELRNMAARSLRAERPGHTLQPTALVHEAFLRLVDQRAANFDSRRHFFAVAATLMRRILVDHARRTHADKRGFRVLVPMQDHMDAAAEEPVELLEVDEALQQLAALDARQAQVVELRYFAGLSVEETAEVLGVSERTVKRDWAVARAFLHRALDESANA
jgi:RNA polymerase sigma factor (TIGR02999 family)